MLLWDYQLSFRNLNEDPSVHGIIVQMPLDSEEEVSLELLTPTSKYWHFTVYLVRHVWGMSKPCQLKSLLNGNPQLAVYSLIKTFHRLTPTWSLMRCLPARYWETSKYIFRCAGAGGQNWMKLCCKIKFLNYKIWNLLRIQSAPQDVDGLCTTNEGRVATGECLYVVPRDNSIEAKMDNY